jgi:hypothetical protein
MGRYGLRVGTGGVEKVEVVMVDGVRFFTLIYWILLG